MGRSTDHYFVWNKNDAKNHNQIISILNTDGAAIPYPMGEK